MAELISFVVPTQSDKVLLVWELSAGPPAEALRHSLSAAFSQFGLLYSVRVFPNAAVARPGFYAIIKFYSSRDAQRAQRACDGKPLFQTSPVKVRLSTRHKALRHQAFALNSSRCQELANFYFGFNGWSKRILKLQELPGAEDEAIAGPGRKQSLKFFCAVEVVLPAYGCRSPGVGIADEPLHQLEEGQPSFLMKRKTAQKLAIQSALSDAFQKLAIVVLGQLLSLESARPKGGGVPLRSQLGRGRTRAVRTALALWQARPCHLTLLGTSTFLIRGLLASLNTHV
ncbi:RAD52 motif-containing protein 1-like isoform X1 [Peromyscus leucopus]|uniref:RAD52 motif-containing protein 1-like isoform X1 n=1 Tax=Peromyscus leucopus TaxID=10041 RepID=UPI001885245C|nr:RAD52 motif-containing protein 1-like isoform X1 [Peromyscus leucopus]XP_037056754.1 RAD52 motif-containing protein 1-like isoform X1 [Peromyscus leucopus]